MPSATPSARGAVIRQNSDPTSEGPGPSPSPPAWVRPDSEAPPKVRAVPQDRKEEKREGKGGTVGSRPGGNRVQGWKGRERPGARPGPCLASLQAGGRQAACSGTTSLLPGLSEGPEARPRHSGSRRGRLAGLESQLHDCGRSVSVPDLGWWVRESRGEHRRSGGCTALNHPPPRSPAGTSEDLLHRRCPQHQWGRRDPARSGCPRQVAPGGGCMVTLGRGAGGAQGRLPGHPLRGGPAPPQSPQHPLPRPPGTPVLPPQTSQQLRLANLSAKAGRAGHPQASRAPCSAPWPAQRL